MIDRSLLREQAEHVVRALATKDPHFDAQRLISLDRDITRIQHAIEQLRHTKNALADQGKKGVTEQLRAQSLDIGRQLKEQELLFKTTEEEFLKLYLSCPNLPDADLPVGGKEANKVVRTVGQQASFAFTPNNHLELGTRMGWLDFETGSVLAGSQFPLYKGDGVRLMYALTMFMLKHNMDHGYEPVLPPALVNEQSLVVAGNFPKFKDQVYAIDQDQLYLIPTAEVSLASMYRNTILNIEQLPIRMTAWTSCFRREAGGHGATERGLIRVHQFEKVELFALCQPEQSRSEQERMLACAEGLLKALGLHYRVSLLAAQDCSFPSARTYDIEVWMPGQGAYYEVSSISNCTDFQARRGGIRYRAAAGGKPTLVHTLNGSSLALSRVMVALLETYQQFDGTVVIPEVLTKQSLFSPRP